ncbi:MAG: lysozyme [Hyphomonadaceae bacterium]|nr:lysozyme [Hyphomonadaceae bacterium]
MPYLPVSTRKIDKIIIHCSATPPYRDVSAADIDHWHKERGWSGIGYNGVIRRDGRFESGRDVNRRPAHAFGQNRTSIGICMIGGLADDNLPAPQYTQAQWRTLGRVISELQAQYPGAEFIGHRDVGNKACPGFDVGHWLRTGEVEL